MLDRWYHAFTKHQVEMIEEDDDESLAAAFGL